MKKILSFKFFVLAFLVMKSISVASAADKPVLSLELVEHTLASVNAHSKQNSHLFAVAVVDDGGNLLYAMRPESVAPGMMDASIGKAQTAARYGLATKFIEEQLTKGRYSYLNLPAVLPIEGGIPIMLHGKIVGAIGVAGSPSSSDDEVEASAIASLLTEAATKVPG
ncbi:Domain of uncharacterised function (DUF336) [Cedecea lapagei]|uniref:Domain of uncharacterized function (DUF336) n=1 Tax=Cedecea lapagei TaxID=158823 RepID=A0A3S4MDP2_9ENTR|nr:heme-binding protein [Cedecea lapagei]VEB95965.1 Domain of uncharacterised function (DUF336) [Cedecea lapagei]